LVHSGSYVTAVGLHRLRDFNTDIPLLTRQ